MMAIYESEIEQGAVAYGVGAYGDTPLRGIKFRHESSRR